MDIVEGTNGKKGGDQNKWRQKEARKKKKKSNREESTREETQRDGRRQTYVASLVPATWNPIERVCEKP